MLLFLLLFSLLLFWSLCLLFFLACPLACSLFFAVFLSLLCLFPPLWFRPFLTYCHYNLFLLNLCVAHIHVFQSAQNKFMYWIFFSLPFQTELNSLKVSFVFQYILSVFDTVHTYLIYEVLTMEWLNSNAEQITDYEYNSMVSGGKIHGIYFFFRHWRPLFRC